METGDAEELLRASGALVLGSVVPLDEERAATVAALTCCRCELADYDDARPRRAQVVRHRAGARCEALGLGGVAWNFNR